MRRAMRGSVFDVRFGAITRLLGAQIAIGAAAIFARFALSSTGPLAISALRLGIATVVLAVVVRKVARVSKRREIAFAIAGFALALHFAMWITSLRFTSVAISTLLVTTTPIWTESYDAIVRRTLPTRTFLGALACAIVGVALIAFPRVATPAPIAGHAALGALLAVLGSVAIGAYLLIVRDAGQRSATERIATRAIVVRTFGWATLALTIAAVFAGEGPPPLHDTSAWGGILAMALVSQLLGHTLLNAALGTFAPSVVALTTLLEPVIAALLAAAVFHEALTAVTLTGGILVLVAVALTLVEAARRERANVAR